MLLRHSRSLLLACTASAVLALASTAHAQNATATQPTAADGTVLDTIVVKGKAGRVKPGSVADTPLASQTTAAEIAEKEIRTVSDLGKTTEPGLDFIKSRPGAPGGLFLRGLGGARVSTLVDDIPVPFTQSIARTGGMSPTTGISGPANSFDFSSLGGVDVVRGADSSRIGSGGLAGALVARTLEPEDLIGEGKDWGGIAKTGYDSEDKSGLGSVAVAKRIGDTSILFQGSYTKGHETDNQGTRDIIGSARTEPNPMDYVQNNLLFKFRHQLEGGHTIGMTAERFDYTSDADLKTLQSAARVTPKVVQRDGWGSLLHPVQKTGALRADLAVEGKQQSNQKKNFAADGLQLFNPVKSMKVPLKKRIDGQMRTYVANTYTNDPEFSGIDPAALVRMRRTIMLANQLGDVPTIWVTPYQPQAAATYLPADQYKARNEVFLDAMQELEDDPSLDFNFVRETEDLASFGGKPGDFYDGIHMLPANTQRVMAYLDSKGLLARAVPKTAETANQ